MGCSSTRVAPEHVHVSKKPGKDLKEPEWGARPRGWGLGALWRAALRPGQGGGGLPLGILCEGWKGLSNAPMPESKAVKTLAAQRSCV